MNKSKSNIKISILIFFLIAISVGVYFENKSREQKHQAAVAAQQRIELRQRVEKEKQEEHALLVQLSRLKKLPICHYAVNMMNTEYERIYTSLADIRNRRNRYNRSDSDNRIVGYTLEQIEKEELQRYNSTKVVPGPASNLISKREEE